MSIPSNLENLAAVAEMHYSINRQHQSAEEIFQFESSSFPENNIKHKNVANFAKI